jgi:hypothetical protein
MTAQPLWTPSAQRIANHRLTRFIGHVNEAHGLSLNSYEDIHSYSVKNAPQFWADVWDFCGIIAETRGERLVADQDKMPGARFFPDAVLNFTENLLRGSGDTPAIIFRGAALRPPALHPVLLRHHRQAQVHRPRRRRHPAPAPEGAGAAHRPGPRATGSVLLHHLRLDDVELAGQRAGLGTLVLFDGSPFHPGREGALGLVAEEGVTVFGTSAKYLIRLEKAGADPGRSTTCRRCARCSPPARRCCRSPSTSSTDAIKADLLLGSISGGTDIVLLLRPGQPDAAGLAASCNAAGWAWPWRSSTTPASRWSASAASWSAPGPSPACRSASGTTRTAPATATAYFERFADTWTHGDFAELTGGPRRLKSSTAAPTP